MQHTKKPGTDQITAVIRSVPVSSIPGAILIQIFRHLCPTVQCQYRTAYVSAACAQHPPVYKSVSAIKRPSFICHSPLAIFLCSVYHSIVDCTLPVRGVTSVKAACLYFLCLDIQTDILRTVAEQ